MKKTSWTEWWVEYDFIEDGVPMMRRTFMNQVEAEAFALEVNGKVYETKAWRV